MKAKPTNKEFQLQLEQMAEQLRQDIHGGIFPANSFLPSESDLAKRFQLSNKSVRKGMEKLVEEGLIVKIPRVGNRVNNVQRVSVTLTLACSESIERDFSLSTLLDDFHRLHPWIRVDTVPFSDMPFNENRDYQQADVITVDSTQFQQLKEDGLHTMLEPLIGSEDVYPFLNDAFIVDDQQYVLPAIFSPIVLCYNRAHFKERNIPEPHGGWTWEDLAKNATKLSENEGRFGFCFHILSENRWPLFLLQSGDRFEWEGTRLRDFRGTKLLEGMKLGKQIILNRDIFPLYLSENNDDINELFIEGKVSMILISYMGMNVLRNTGLDYDITPVPYIHEPRTLLVAIGFGMNRFSRNKEAAQILIDYFVSRRTQNMIGEITLSLPALQQIERTEQSAASRPSRYGLYREIISSYRMHSELNFPWRLNHLLAGQMKAYWADLLDEEEMCDRIVDKLSARETERAGKQKKRELTSINE
ncbi:extracellular solute-binding protein [Paenibacillus eucommiae]|uniref:Multiple sugar transport system substrate-binding protein n=1 Tax=Paenibacillus eucommiae TaxID=1355755 RepID=A0ABS4J5F3_9BACL|nr:extracellular solute-binding protein [Paenibacillus eucommiae]MBP1995057.1 multiple sugar transport system substrate-binding protein [Paenibacillus eucommiae]